MHHKMLIITIIAIVAIFMIFLTEQSYDYYNESYKNYHKFCDDANGISNEECDRTMNNTHANMVVVKSKSNITNNRTSNLNLSKSNRSSNLNSSRSNVY